MQIALNIDTFKSKVWKMVLFNNVENLLVVYYLVFILFSKFKVFWIFKCWQFLGGLNLRPFFYHYKFPTMRDTKMSFTDVEKFRASDKWTGTFAGLIFSFFLKHTHTGSRAQTIVPFEALRFAGHLVHTHTHTHTHTDAHTQTHTSLHRTVQFEQWIIRVKKQIHTLTHRLTHSQHTHTHTQSSIAIARPPWGLG